MDAVEFTESFNTARACMGAGRLPEALSILNRLVDAAPEHVEVRNALAVLALSANDLRTARQHVQAALNSAPQDPLTLNQLANIQEAEGDGAAALASYRRLLTAQPALFAARLSCARLLEQGGDLNAAVLHYARAIDDAQRQGRWISESSTPPAMRAAVVHALSMVREHKRSLCDQILSGIVARHGQADMDRVIGFALIQLGEAVYDAPDKRQHPTRFPVPGLAQSPYIDKTRIRGVDQLEAQAAQIRAELLAVMSDPTGREPVFGDPALAQAFLANQTGPSRWDGYYFYRHGQRNENNAAACPVTAAAIDQLPLSRVTGHGPEVLFSILGPGTHLLPHYGVTNARLVGHLPLIVPANCALNVAGIEHAWKEGEVVVFDDTYSHEAWNRSDQIRVVMIFDLWHPDLSEVEIQALRELQEVLGGFSTRSSSLEF
ncbi:aspartyl/asparaginyl beta-hydroxylase domain-containing protein [Ideonella sp. 4Y16]|uniref:Aspartyl/asparaginyl beta-hydroxylase domain-containing protein n=1 Tax=Ideonella alba TaxID=2824118 RepID=A0A940YJE1_9BURK|nr:aspartyl/asparaginyl beta-hydroxylase domain-containing protein [Ideonella alba]MBQ0930959.1 aspartyl/asparaginyl beta-hydroxylase domain-containing protein [Ideonella alba]MBQ0942377.1 aspartyl/asparaginyl beta-hydroxylase domain-containing protein [Ideonella alba]